MIQVRNNLFKFEIKSFPIKKYLIAATFIFSCKATHVKAQNDSGVKGDISIAT